MHFILGLITGILLSILVVAALTYFKSAVERKIALVERLVESKGPKPKGFLFDPPSEADEMREKIIEENDRKGVDTKISDLI